MGHIPAISRHRRFPCSMQSSSCPLYHIVDPEVRLLPGLFFPSTSPAIDFKTYFGFVFRPLFHVLSVVSTALAVLSLQTHRPVVGPRHSSSSRPSLFGAYGPTTLFHQSFYSPTSFFAIYVKRPHRLETMIVTRVALLTSIVWCKVQKYSRSSRPYLA